MKLYVKRVDAKSSVFTITVDNKETVGSLKERIGGVLDLCPDAIRLLYQGHPLSNTTTSLKSYGVEDSSRISVVYVPSSDTNATVFKSLVRKVKSFSLEELERYAKFRNQRIS